MRSSANIAGIPVRWAATPAAAVLLHQSSLDCDETQNMRDMLVDLAFIISTNGQLMGKNCFDQTDSPVQTPLQQAKDYMAKVNKSIST